MLSLTLVLLMAACHGTGAKNEPPGTLTFEGTVEALAPDLGILSGRILVYRLAKYRVNKVCSGQYSGNEIVADHLILSGREFEGINVGDRVRVTVTVSDKIGTRFDSKGIRDQHDVVTVFFLGEEIRRLDKEPPCPGA